MINYLLGFPITLLVNSVIWHIISHIMYKVIWRKSGLDDQKLLLNYFLAKIKSKKHSSKPLDPNLCQ